MLVRVPEDGAGGEEVPVLGAGVQGTLETHLPVLEGRLYLSISSASESVQPAKDEIFVTMHKRMNYVPFCADFGPLNLGATCQMCRKLRVLLASPNLQGSKIVYCTPTPGRGATPGLACSLCVGAPMARRHCAETFALTRAERDQAPALPRICLPAACVRRRCSHSVAHSAHSVAMPGLGLHRR